MSSFLKRTALVAGLFATSFLYSCEKDAPGPNKETPGKGNGKNVSSYRVVDNTHRVFVDGLIVNGAQIASVGFHYDGGSDVYLSRPGHNISIEHVGNGNPVSGTPTQKGENAIFSWDKENFYRIIIDNKDTIIYSATKVGAPILEMGQFQISNPSQACEDANARISQMNKTEFKLR